MEPNLNLAARSSCFRPLIPERLASWARIRQTHLSHHDSDGVVLRPTELSGRATIHIIIVAYHPCANFCEHSSLEDRHITFGDSLDVENDEKEGPNQGPPHDLCSRCITLIQSSVFKLFNHDMSHVIFGSVVEHRHCDSGSPL